MARINPYIFLTFVGITSHDPLHPPMSNLGFSREEQIRLLAAQYGVEEARAAELLGVTERFNGAPVNGAPVVPRHTARGPLTLPFRMSIPWSSLCSDNERKTAALTRLADGSVYPRLMTSRRYKAAQDAIRDRARAVVGLARPVDYPLRIEARIWLPPARRNDPLNFAKVVHDALEGIVYDNDNQLHDVHWIRAGVDIDAPRAEITITPL